jgi:hypothetical protein
MFNTGPILKPIISNYANTVYSACDGVSRLEICINGVCDLQPSAVSNKVTINTFNSTVPIYLYSDGHCTMYMYTLDEFMRLNRDSSLMFSDYAGRLEFYNLGKIYAGTATNMYSMFGNSKAADLSVETWNTYLVTNMAFMFSTTSFYTTADDYLDNESSYRYLAWNVIRVTNMHSMFRNSTSSAPLSVMQWNTSNVKDMSRMFEHARVRTLYMSGWNTYNVTNMYNMFYYTNNLIHINMYGWDLRNLSNATNMLSISSIQNFYSPGMIKAGINIIFPATFKYGSTSYTRFNNTNATLRNKLFNRA